MNEISKRTDAMLYDLFAGSADEARGALEEAYNRHSQRIYAYCRRILGDEHSAADMLQETFVRYFEQGKQKKIVLNHASYLFKIARNLCYTHKERGQRFAGEVEDYHVPTLDVSYEHTQLVDLIKSALEEVPHDLREAFVLREYNGLSYQEISDIIGESMDVVKVRIFRAKKKIREILKPYVSELEE